MNPTKILLWVVLTLVLILSCSIASYHAGWHDAMATWEQSIATTEGCVQQ